MGSALTALLAVTGHPISTSVFIGFIASILALPLLLIAREAALYSAAKPLPVERTGRIAEWFTAVAREAGAQRTTVLYVYRKGVSLQVVQHGEPLLQRSGAERRRFELSIATLIHKASWNGLLAATKYHEHVVITVPARTVSILEPLAHESRAGVTLHVGTRRLLNLVYRALREVVAAVEAGTGRLFVAYTTTKLMARLILKGLLSVEGEAAETLDKTIPAEPPWIKARVLRQLREESIESISV